MAWIESHQTLLTHRKTGRLARALCISKITAIGHLHAFWWWCLDNAPNGDLTDIDAADIADGACWEGDPTAFLAALIHAGFVDQADASPAVHEWMDYAGKLIEQRKAHAERMRSVRRAHKPTPQPPPEARNGHIPGTDIARDEHVPSTVLAREAIPDSTVHNSTVDHIPPTPQTPEPATVSGAVAPGAVSPAPTKRTSKPKREDRPISGWNYPLLWQLVTEQQGYTPDWNYAAQTKAVNRILAKHPDTQPGDLARFLAYKATCFRADPHGQPTFTAYEADYAGWLRAGKPSRFTREDGGGGRPAPRLLTVTGRPYQVVQPTEKGA